MNVDRYECAERIACIGFGEAAAAFVQGWRTRADVNVSAFDIKTDDAKSREGKLQDYQAQGVRGTRTAAELVADADIIVSAVTAEAAAEAARSVADDMRPGTLYLDVNSAAPSRKREAAGIVTAAGGAYVDVAVMAPVHPTLHHTPLLISGPDIARAQDLMQRLDMRFEVVSDKIGDASTIKMVRSVMIKGIEALVAESIVGAVQQGIDLRILASLDITYPGMNWTKRAGYMLERMVRHGGRRAEEMREVTKTMDELGIGGPMAAATAQRQQRVADLGLLDAFDGEPPEDHRILAQAILDAEKERDR